MSDSVLAAKSILDRFRLNGRTALVTGGGSGIGRGYAHALGEAGAAVAVADIVSERAETVAHELASKGIDAIAVQVDVTKEDSVAAMIDAIMKKWGKLTIGVNNAGVGQWVDSEKQSYADWKKLMELNLDGVFLCAQAEARVMLPAGYGKIISTASMSGTIVNTPQNQAAYNASKAAVIHLTKSLAAEWSSKGVRVNSISPGYTRTAMVDDLLATVSEMVSTWMRLTPMGKMLEVSDLQGAVVYLASEASDFVTGHDLVVDGGYTIW